MSLNKVKPGSNMYQCWITHTHNHLGGACPHACSYCSTQDMARRFPVMKARYTGPPRLIEKELSVNYGTGKTIFVENCSDLFAEGIASQWIERILTHCRDYPENTYIFQTKNPGRVNYFLTKGPYFPPRFMIGTTTETNRTVEFGKAPSPWFRMEKMRSIQIGSARKFLTIEPIMKFDLGKFVTGILWAVVATIYIGADSKNHHLPEPTGPEIGALIRALRDAGKTVVLKSNLKRLY